MRKLPIVTAALVAGALSLHGPSALAIGPDKGGQEVAGEGTKVTGTVMEVDQDKGEIKINDQTFVMPPSNDAMMPQVGSKITITYEERDGKNTITKIGQAEK